MSLALCLLRANNRVSGRLAWWLLQEYLLRLTAISSLTSILLSVYITGQGAGQRCIDR